MPPLLNAHAIELNTAATKLNNTAMESNTRGYQMPTLLNASAIELTTAGMSSNTYAITQKDKLDSVR